MKKIILKIKNLFKKKDDDFIDIQWIDDYLQECIAEKTGFDKNKINLQISQRLHPDSPTIDCHEFIYEDKKYLLIGNDLKSLD